VMKLCFNRKNHDLHVPPGHYYSPIPSANEFEEATEELIFTEPVGVDLNDNQQILLMNSFTEKYFEISEWFEDPKRAFSLGNSWFFGSDAITTAFMVSWIKPDSVIEIGSGHSTALLYDLKVDSPAHPFELLSIDPNIERAQSLLPDFRFIQKRVQDLPIDFFNLLTQNDILFIDSSHVLKTSSDVLFLFSEVFPALNSGVYIHIHDVFYPFVYPDSWLKGRVGFNETYALRLILQSTNFRIVYWNDYLEKTYSDIFKEKLPKCVESSHPTGGIWIQKI
jgi:hypothetical protein